MPYPPQGAGAASFLALSDTPASYAGQAQKITAVVVGETGLEFRVHSKFTTTKVFDGSTASPPTIYVSPLSMIPYTHFGGMSYGVVGYGAIIIGDYLYVFGGKRAPSGDQFTNLCYRMNLDSLEWERLANMPSVASTWWKGNPCGYYNGKIYFLTRLNGPGSYYYRVMIYNIASDAWETTQSLPFLSNNVDNLVCFACTDSLYVYQSWSAGTHRFDKMDYATKAWTSLNALPVQAKNLVGAVIGDDCYVGCSNDLKTYKYDKGLDQWIDQAQNVPFSLVNGGGFNFTEDLDCIWARTHAQDPAYYRYTPAGGWVHQFTEGRDTYEWQYLLKRTSNGKLYVLWAEGWNLAPDPENPWAGAILYCEPGGVWHLLTQEFAVGDLLILFESAGIPVKVELGGQPLFTGSGMDTVYIVAAGSYFFSLSKDFDIKSVQIWRSVWG